MRAFFRWDRVLPLVCGACLIVSSYLVVRDLFAARALARAASPRRLVQSDSLHQRGFTRGSTKPHHNIIVFSDFECPFCRVFAKTLDSIATTHPEIRITERHFPLTMIHAHAMKAAIAAECAGTVGDYASMRDVLFAQHALIQNEDWVGLARIAAVSDTASFRSCLSSDRFRYVVEQDISTARRLGLNATPSVIVDGWLLPGTPTLVEIEQRLRLASKTHDRTGSSAKAGS